MESRTHCNHQLESFCNGSERRSSCPRVERWCIDSFYVVHEQLGDQRDIVPNFLAALREPLHVRPGRGHSLIFDIAQPTAKNGKPISVLHTVTPAASTVATAIPERSIK